MIFKSGRKASPLTSLLDIILLVLFAQMILTSQLTSNQANKKIEKAENEFKKAKDEMVFDYEEQINKLKKEKESVENENKRLDKKLRTANDDINSLNLEKHKLVSKKEELEKNNEKLASEARFIAEYIAEKDKFDKEKTEVLALKQKLDGDSKVIEEDKIANTKLKLNLNNQIDLLKRAFRENEKSFSENGIDNMSDISIRKLLSSSKALVSLKTILPIIEVIVTDKNIILKQYNNKEYINYPEDIEKYVDEDKRDMYSIQKKCKEIEKAIKKLCEKNGTNTDKPSILIVPSMSKNLNINYSDYYSLLFNDNSGKIEGDFIGKLHVPSEPIIIDKELIDEY